MSEEKRSHHSKHVKKEQIMTDIMRQLPMAHSVPKRLRPLYLNILATYKLAEAEPSEQLLIIEIAYLYCRITDAKDMTRLFGTQCWLPAIGDSIETLADNRDKMEELKLIPSLQRSLSQLIAALAGCKKKPRTEDYLDLARTFKEYAREK